jgi:uncharacterized protein (TIGR02099 family)
MIHHIKRATRHLIFWSLIASALGLLAVRVSLHLINHYKIELAAEISKQVDAPVTIGHLKTRFRHFSPQLVLQDIAIAAPDNNQQSPPIQLKELRIGIHLLNLILSQDVLSSSWITLVGAKLTVKKQVDGSLAIVGLKAGDGQPLWLLQGRQYQVLQSSLTWQDEQKHGKSLVFDDVNVMIRNNGDWHRVNVLINLQEKQGELLKASFDINGNIFEPLAINGTSYIEGKAINLPAWITVDLPLTLGIKSGVGDFKIWGEWQRSQLISMTADVQAEQLRISEAHKADFIAQHFSTLFFWLKHDNQWSVDVDHFALATADKKYPSGAFTVSGVSADDQQLHQLALSAPHIDLQAFATLGEFFAPDAQAKILAQAQLKGHLDNFTLSTNFDTHQFTVNGQFSQLSSASIQTLPGMDNFSGHINGTEQQGSVQMSTKNAQFKAPNLFRTPIPINTLNGALTWQQNADNWTIASSLLTLNTPDIDSKSRLQLIIPKTDKPVFMDLQIAFTGKDMSKAGTYYPVSVMDPNLVYWLDHAFVGGHVPKGGVLFYGNLDEFPFINGQGVFEALFEAQQLDLTYHPDWPHITGAAGEVLFSQNSLEINLTGKTNNLDIKRARISTKTLNKCDRLQVDGVFVATVGDTLAFLQKTPLILPIKAVTNAITPRGNTEVNLALSIPLVPNITPKIDGAATINNADLTVNSLDLLIDKMTGTLKFDALGIYTDNINAEALGYPVKIAIKHDEQKSTISVAGRTDINQLSKQFKLFDWSAATGVSDYKVQLQLPYNNSPPDLNVESMLAGISLNLPDGLAKTAQQQRALSLNFSLVDKPLLPISISYDNQLKAALNFDVKQQNLQAGHILIGTGKLEAPEQGIKLEINSEQLALQNWLGLGFSMAQGKPTQTTSQINEIRIHSNSSVWKKTPLGAFDLNLKPNGKQWTGQLNSQFAKGKLSIPFDLKGTNRVTLNMDELDLSLAKQLNSKDSDSTEIAALIPAEMPLITLTSNKTRWQNVELGQLSLIAERLSNGISFKNITLNSEIQKLTLSGDWQVNGKQSVTRAKGRLDMIRADELFKQLDINKDFTKTSGVIDFDVQWQGAPQQFSLATLRGQLDTEFKEGRLLSVEPGFGRVLGVLAVAQWIKRLQLDFSDIYEEGLTFNSITGHFNVAQGKVHTDNLIVDAIPAKITLTGDTDLLRRTVDYSIMVAPKSADALPIAGTIVGKVSSLIGRSLTGKDQDGFFFGSQYSVSGEWGKVQVTPRHENDGLLQKTWNGLTDFSWINQQK